MREIVEDKGRVRPVVEGDFQCDENGNSTRVYEVLSIVGRVDGSTKLSYISKKLVPIGIPLTDTEYWYPFQVIAIPKGDKGDDGKSAYDLYVEHGGTIETVEEWLESLNGVSPILRVSSDGMSLEISSDNGKTWLPFVVDFNKLRVIGYVDSINQLPRNAQIGDIYGVWESQPTEENPEAGVYRLYINTVKDWLLDYTITKVYDYDTELPSSATDGTAVLVPVRDLTLDKEKVDGYKVYRYNQSILGWTMVLNTAEIYAEKADIINYGDNVYALVQGATEGTYELYKRQVGWVYFGTNASIIYHLVQDVNQGTANNVLSGKAVKDAINAEVTARHEAITAETERAIAAEEAITEDLASYKQEVKDTYGDYTENPEFVRVVTDRNDKVLYGVQKDGNFYFGAGCPNQVKDYVKSELDKIIGVGDVTEKIDTLNEMIAFFDQISHDTTLKELLAASAAVVEAEKERAIAAEQTLSEGKVDKEEGKSLIDAEYADGIHYIENPEFSEVKVDAEDRILEATMKDGTKLLPVGYSVGGNVVKTIDNPEFIGLWVDGMEHILMAIKADGDIYYGCGVPSQIKAYVDEKIAEVSPEGVQEIIDFIGDYLEATTLEELLNGKVDKEEGKSLIDAEYAEGISHIENPEFIEVKTDAKDKLLEGTQIDGTKVFGGNVKVLGSMNVQGIAYTVVSNPEWLAAWVDAADKVLFGFKADGKTFVGNADFLDAIKENATKIALIQEAIEDVDFESLKVFSLSDNPEFLQVETDAEDKVLGGRKVDGTKFENMPVETPAATVSSTDNPEWSDVKTDGNDRILEGIKKDGTKVIGGEVEFLNGIPQQIKDYIDSAAIGGSGVIDIEIDDATGDIYATYNDETGVTDVYMDDNGDIYVEIEEE